MKKSQSPSRLVSFLEAAASPVCGLVIRLIFRLARFLCLIRIEQEFHLPEAIIQHIQSFLNAKEAAQTTLLSKWLTRPNLDFDYNDFERYSPRKETLQRFCEFVDKTVERYDKLNLKIHTLRLHMQTMYFHIHEPYSVASKCIVKALKMGATGLDLKFNSFKVALPDEVFGSENLIRLSLSGWKIGLGVDGKVSCWRLKSLDLERVRVEDDVIWYIISSCPLIENFSLSPKEYEVMELGPVDGPFNKLKSLLLLRIKVDTVFFDDFSFKFPCLKDLSLEDCNGYEEIKISSHSLECISFIKDEYNRSIDFLSRVELDVPSIRKFTFSGQDIPSLSFKTTSSKWESNTSISDFLSRWATSFLELNKFLTELSPSKVSLSLRIPFWERFDCPEDVPKPEVENVMIPRPDANFLNLFEGLLRCCRPIYVTQYLWQLRNCEIRNYAMCQKETRDCAFMEYVYKSVVQQVGLKCGLDQVDVEFFDEFVSAWRPRLIDASTSPGADE